jgi:hypothetical protein
MQNMILTWKNIKMQKETRIKTLNNSKCWNCSQQNTRAIFGPKKEPRSEPQATKGERREGENSNMTLDFMQNMTLSWTNIKIQKINVKTSRVSIGESYNNNPPGFGAWYSYRGQTSVFEFDM